MKRSDFKNINDQRYVETCRKLKKNGGECYGINCSVCPFAERNTTNGRPCDKNGFSIPGSDGAKDENLVKSAKEFLKLAKKDAEKCESPYKLIEQERKRQNKLHPEFPVSIPQQISILLEEVGEVAKAFNENDVENYEVELVQVAAVCVRILEVRN